MLVKAIIRTKAKVPAESGRELVLIFFFQAEDGIRDLTVTGVQTCALPISFRMDNRIFTVIGVSPKGFAGTEPGTMIDVFVPTVMHEGITHSDWSWFRTLAILRPGVRLDTVREKLQPVMQVFHEERAKGFKTEDR